MNLQNYSVVVMVGTHHCPFDRLINWADKLAATGIDVLVQYGNSKAPSIADGIVSLTQQQMLSLRQSAKILICHGGPSIMVEWLRAGFRPVVVPRDPALGEHLDEHQMLFTDFMAHRGWVDVAASVDDLIALVRNGLEGVSCPQDLADLDSVAAAHNVGRLVADALRARRDR